MTPPISFVSDDGDDDEEEMDDMKMALASQSPRTQTPRVVISLGRRPAALCSGCGRFDALRLAGGVRAMTTHRNRQDRHVQRPTGRPALRRLE